MIKRSKNTIEWFDRNIERILKEIEEQDILIPDIQRGLVWKNDQKTAMLKTLFNKYPYGVIILAEPTEEKNKLYIIDGLQRLTTIIAIERNVFRFCDDELKEYIYDIFNEDFSKYYSDEKNIRNFFETWFKYIKKEKQVKDDNIEDISSAVTLKFDDNEIKRNFVAACRRTFDNFYKMIFDSTNIKVQKFSGSSEEIAKIFCIINQQGTPLNDIEILQSKLDKCLIELADEEFKQKIIDYKEKYFESILGEFSDTLKTTTNNKVTIFNYLFYSLFKIFENKEIEKMENVKSLYLNKLFFDINEKKLKGKIEWFRIARFILEFFCDEAKDGSLEKNIKTFYEAKELLSYQTAKQIQNKLINAISWIEHNLAVPNIHTLKSLKKPTLDFSNSEAFLLVATIFKLQHEQQDVNDFKKAILTNLISFCVNNPFKSASNDTSYNFFRNNEILQHKNLQEIFYANFEKNMTNKSATKIYVFLMMLINSQSPSDILIIKPFNEVINSVFTNDTKKRYEESIYNWLIFVTDESANIQDLKINWRKIDESIEHEFFYKHCQDQDIKSKYKELLKRILQNNEESVELLNEIYELRRGIILGAC